MSREDLQGLLAKLRDEIGEIEGTRGDAHERLTALIGEIEAHMDDHSGDKASTESTPEISGFIEQFELEHPRVTGILNEIMVMLSNMGI